MLIGYGKSEKKRKKSKKNKKYFNVGLDSLKSNAIINIVTNRIL